MIIIGIDPGLATIGYGVIDYTGNQFKTLDYGILSTPAHTPVPERLEKIYTDATALFAKYRPDAISMEELFFSKNVTTGIPVAEARGVLLLAAQKNGINVYEYNPREVKQSVVGYGKAEKRQVMEMTRMMLNLEKIPRPDDAADALAMAVCHAHCSGSLNIYQMNRGATRRRL